MVNFKKHNLKFRNDLDKLDLSAVKYLVQHHMAHPSWGLTDVHNYHRDGNKWAGIGYNFWIDFEGNIYSTRGLDYKGVHVKDKNSITVGVGYQGDFTKQKMPDAQLKAGIELNKWLIKQLPNVSASSIVGHKDLQGTTCPGQNFRMKELVDGVRGTIGSDAPKVPTPKPSKPSKPSKPKSGNPDMKTTSLVDYLISINEDHSFNNRRRLANQYGIKNYKGTAAQNLELLKKLRSGSKPKQKPSYSGTSVVDYLISINQPHSLNHRAKLARRYGIKNYKGTAAQNLELLSKLRADENAANNPKPKGDMKTNSIVDYLKSIGEDHSFSNRARLARVHGISNYRGTADQNATLLKKLRN